MNHQVPVHFSLKDFVWFDKKPAFMKPYLMCVYFDENSGFDNNNCWPFSIFTTTKPWKLFCSNNIFHSDQHFVIFIKWYRNNAQYSIIFGYHSVKHHKNAKLVKADLSNNEFNWNISMIINKNRYEKVFVYFHIQKKKKKNYAAICLQRNIARLAVCDMNDYYLFVYESWYLSFRFFIFSAPLYCDHNFDREIYMFDFSMQIEIKYFEMFVILPIVFSTNKWNE